MSWVPYIRHQLLNAHVPLGHAWDAEPAQLIKKDMPEPPYAELFCSAAGRTLELTFGYRLEGNITKLHQAMDSHEPVLDEIISLDFIEDETSLDLGVRFVLKKDKALLVIRDLGTFSEFSANYEFGVDYDAKSVIDDLIGSFLRDYNKGPPRE